MTAVIEEAEVVDLTALDFEPEIPCECAHHKEPPPADWLILLATVIPCGCQVINYKDTIGLCDPCFKSYMAQEFLLLSCGHTASPTDLFVRVEPISHHSIGG